jgi:hypothetical protein
MGNFPAVSRQRDLRAEHVPAGAAPTAYTHLLTGDRAPIGRVHEVGFGVLVGDESNNHFLTQMDADSSMGAKRMLESGRRGPFRSSSGPSRVMDKSAHVSYRRRGHTMEITVRRGVSSYELDTLIGKLAAHRMSTSNSHVFFISRRRKKIGKLSTVDLNKLRELISKTLMGSMQVGLQITDAKQHGILLTEAGHSRAMKHNFRHPKKLVNALA